MLDIIIIGSGPAGLSAAVYAKRANLDVLVVERIYLGAGQVAESSMVENYLGFTGINGYELGEKFRQHAEGLGVEFISKNADKFEKIKDGWRITFSDGETSEAGAVIYAAGARHRHLGVSGEDKFAGKGVSYCATCDGAFFREKVVVVVGGGNTAMDDALYLSGLCKKVYLVHRRDEFRGSEITLEKINKKDNIELVMSARISQIKGEDKVSEVLLEDGRVLKTDGVFIAVGMEPVTEEIKDIVELDKTGYVIADETGETSAEGFFVAGDVRTKALRQVVTAASDGANALFSAKNYLGR